MVKNIDYYLCTYWNNNSDYKILPEHFWDFCRMLEKNGLVTPNETAISTVSIGPFNIASDLTISNNEFLSYFIESIIPIFITNYSNLPFNEVYSLFFIPLSHIFLNLLSKSCYIKDSLQWEILLYIKQQNDNNIYPNIENIHNEFSHVEIHKIKNALLSLCKSKNMIGDEQEIIRKNILDGYESLV